MHAAVWVMYTVVLMPYDILDICLVTDMTPIITSVLPFINSCFPNGMIIRVHFELIVDTDRKLKSPSL